MKELHLYLDTPPAGCLTSYTATLKAIIECNQIVNTTQLPFLSFEYRYRLFVHCDNKMHEITLGKCEGTNREIRESMNLEKLLIAGEFDYF